MPNPTPRTIIVTLPPRYKTENIYPYRTTIGRERYPIRAVTREEVFTCTTVLKFDISEEQVTVRSREYRPTTKVYTWFPEEQFTEEEIVPTMPEIEIITPPVRVPERRIPVPPVEERPYRPKYTVYTERVTPTTIHEEYITPRLPSRIRARPPPLTVTYYFTILPRTVDYKRPRTTARTEYYPIRRRTVQQRREETTIRIEEVEEQKTRYEVRTRETPATRRFTILPSVRTYPEHFKPTTVVYEYIHYVDCYLEMHIGPCKEKLKRWYYNRVSRKCETFYYGGCEGNGNMFESKEDCERQCVEKRGPRPRTVIVTIPPPERTIVVTVPRTTSRYYTQTVPPGKIRKTAPPPEVRIITLPPPERIETETIPPTRHHTWEIPLTRKRIPKEFPEYKTRIVTYQPRPYTRWETRTPSTVRTFSYPARPRKFTQTRLKTTTRTIYVTVPTKTEKRTRPTPATKVITYSPPVVTYPEHFKPSTVIYEHIHAYDCYSDKHIGQCEGKLTRWYYNRDNKRCETFIYGGCQGNGNNFESKEDCESRCNAVYKGPPRRTIIVTIPHIPPELCFTILPTTSHYFTRPVPPGRRTKIVTPPTVKYITVPPRERTRWETFTPPRQYTRYIPQKKKTYHVTFPQLPTKRPEWPPRPWTREQTFKPTTVRKYTVPVTPATYTSRRKGTTLIVRLIPQPTRTVVGSSTPRVTRIITYTPPVVTYPENFKKPTIMYEYAPPSNCYSEKKRGPCKEQITRWYYNQRSNRCEQFIYGGCEGNGNNFQNKRECERRCLVRTIPPHRTVRTAYPLQSRTHTEYITRPTTVYRTQRVTPFTRSYTRKPERPEILTRTPATREYTNWKRPTTSRFERYTVPQERYTQNRKRTTIRFERPEIEVYTQKEEYTPETEDYVFPPEVQTQREIRTPTSIVTYFETIPTRSKEWRRTPPRTRHVTYTRPAPYRTQRITPTTYIEVEIPKRTMPGKQFPSPRTKIITQQPKKTTWYEYITPTTIKVWTQRPRPRPSYQATWPPRPPKTDIRTRPSRAWTQGYTLTPETITVPGIPEEFECIYPTPPSTTVCESMAVCPPGEEERWRQKILDCTMQELQEKGKSIYEIIIREKNMDELQKVVTCCIKKKGDTSCRSRTFGLVEWVMVKVKTYVGEYGEHAKNMHVENDEMYEYMKKCVAMIDEQELENCYPGLYQSLTDIILYEKQTRMLEKNEGKRCLRKVFKHCKPFVKTKIEERLKKVFGFCIKITGPNDKSGCTRSSEGYSHREERSERTEQCSEEEFQKFLDGISHCVNTKVEQDRSEGTRITKFRVITMYIGCLKDPDCEMRSVGNILEVLKHLHDLLKRTDDKTTKTDDKCLKNVKEDLTKCFEVMQGAIPKIGQLQNKMILVKHVIRCVADKLGECNVDVKQKMVEFVTKLICQECPVLDVPGDGGFEISTVRVKRHKIGICSLHYRNADTDSGPTRPTAQDDCIPVGEGENAVQIRVPACTEERLDGWIKDVKECVESKVTNIGLRNPDYLTLDKVVLILKECVNNKGSLKCRIKHRDDFKKIMSTFLQLITTNILSEDSKDVRNSLRFDAIGNKCKSILFNYLTFDTDPQMVKRTQAKAFECIHQSTKDITHEVLEDLLDVYEIAMVLDAEKILQLYNQGVLTQCDPDKVLADKAHFYNAPAYINCGKGGILVRKRRNVADDEQDETSVPTEKSPFLKPPQKMKRAAFAGAECTTDDYKQYFDKLQVCGDKRLHLKFRKKRDKCKLNDLEYSWKAMVDCMIENVGDELTCHVANEDQMSEFLEFAARTLHSSSQNISDSCPVQPNCYGSEAPNLYMCSSLYLQLVKAKESTIPMWDILDGSSRLLECLNPIWPDCSLDVQFLSLHFLYLPLGLNYNSNIMQGLTFVSCEDGPSNSVLSFPQCMSQANENDIDQEVVDFSSSSIQACRNCIRKKKGICTSNNDTELIHCLRGEFFRLNHCLKYMISDENCLNDMTTRIQYKCLPEFYRFYKNIAKGIVLNSIEYFRKFNECLVDFKSDCPSDYKKFAFRLYYDLLGLSSIFKPQLPYDRD